MCVVLKFPLDRVPSANDLARESNKDSAQIIVFDGVRYSRAESLQLDDHRDRTKPAKPC